MRKTITLVICATALAGVVGLLRSEPVPEGRPKLVVILVVDQMRADYIDQYKHQWTGGLRKMLRRGAWFREAAYPYLNTVTCPGHATISTGTFPATHGMILNSWWDRGTGREVACTADADSPMISYGERASGGESAKWLRAQTLAEALRAGAPAGSHTVVFSLKARSAITLAGVRADVVTWFDANEGMWETSAAYGEKRAAFLEEFLRANPVEGDFKKTWKRRLGRAAYRYTDSGDGELSPPGWSRTFPHPMRANSSKPDPDFYRRWRMSPFSDTYLVKLARAAVDALQLGQGAGTDFLGIGFSALDSAGHLFGPRSHEVQDLLVWLDESIGDLLEHLDRTVGPENYVVALSSDHGVAEIPQQLRAEKKEGGRVVTNEVVTRVEKALEGQWGPGKYVSRLLYTDLYFAPGVYEKLLANPVALEAAVSAIRSIPGILKVYRAEEVRGGVHSDDATLRAAALSYFPGRSGDLILTSKPNWFFMNARTADPVTHGTAHWYDTRVPVLLYGTGIRPGEYGQAATPADIAPTLAHLCGVRLEHAEGRVLSEALRDGAARDGASGTPTQR